MCVSAVCQALALARGCCRRSMLGAVVCSSAHETHLQRAVEPIAEVAEAGDDELVRVEPAIDDRRVDVDVGMVPLDERDAFGRRDDADDADGRARRRAAAGRAPRRRCRRSRASDRSSARSCRRARAAASSSTATRPPSSRRAAGRCGRRAPPAPARARRRACRARRAAPARPRHRRRRCGPAPGRAASTTRSAVGRSRSASAASSTLMRVAARRNSSGGGRACRAA